MTSASPLTSYQMVSIIRNGLTKTQAPKKITIVGAGISGLVAASLLKDAGHQVTILESSDRVGGRIYTLRSPFSNGLYLEAGAMRIPETHFLPLEYIRKFRLSINEFVNNTPDDLIFVNGVKTSRKMYQRNPHILRFPVAPHERGKTALQLAKLATDPVTDFINQDPVNHWPIVIKEFDKYSMEVFLKYNPVGVSLSKGAVDMIKVLFGLEGFPELSFLEVLRHIMIFSSDTRFYEISGGIDRLPQAFLPQLKKNILFGRKMTKIAQYNNRVTIHSVDTKTSEPFQVSGDVAIITIPFSLMNFVEVEPRDSFSYNKWKAIHTLHYVSSTKIGIEFKRRFWEEQGKYGGQTITDMPSRFAFFPSHGFGEPRGIVLASYTWEDDALPWVSMSQDDQIIQSLNNLAKIHGKQVYREFVTGTAHNWDLYPFSAGAFSMFKPGQETELSPCLAEPEGRVHFAGEHTSDHRGWIQGAIQSGIRAAHEVNNQPGINFNA